MRPDHYASLGVEPNASPAEIRAAYVKLLREHHPDRNNSPEAVDRTKTIIAAFKVLGDFDQRSHYDWDRRRDREAAEAAAAEAAPRRRAKAGLAAGGIGLAAVGAWLLMPVANPHRSAAAPRTAAVEPDRTTAAPVRTAAERPATPKREPSVIRMRPTLAKTTQATKATKAKPPERVARSEMPKTEPTKAAAKPTERLTLKSDPPRQSKTVPPLPNRVAAKPATAVRVAATVAPAPAKPRQAPERQIVTRQSSTRTTTDLASLDQFVMNFYGQSWRYGDAPKRNALEQTRAGFVVRRGACIAETCKRDAYLRLMRDVSAIVETGKPQKR